MLKNQNKNKTVFVALSGGVDSSVAALLLKKKGYKVVGIFMRNWSENIGQKGCTYKEDEEDARLVCNQLGIPFYVFNFEKEYKKEVVDYLIKGYQSGITPNPDIMCNKYIKFGLFFRKAISLGADFIATGHYARVKQIKNKKLGIIDFKLLRAKDSFKDQTYFLYQLNQEILKHILFPIGNYFKKEVRDIAKKNRLITASKKDSQGICFVGKIPMRDFLKRYIEIKKGDILNEKSQKIGEHNGFYFYTIGQRWGLNINDGKGPYYVAQKNTLNNTLVVVNNRNHPLLFTKELLVKEVNWVSGEEPQFPLKCLVRIRHQGDLLKAKILKMEKTKNCVIISSKEPIWAPAEGQAAVFYKKNELLGGGIIAKSFYS